jgi:hypothetical protein
MSDEQNVDMMAGLNAVVAIMEAIRVDVRAIGPVDRVRLASLQWAVDKLAGDLHDANVEIRKARLEVASAKREADEAREVRDAARQLHLVECRKYNAEVERRLALEKQVAELTKKLGELPDEEDEPFPEPYPWQIGDEIECPDGTRRRVKERDENGWLRLDGLFSAVPQFEWERAGWKLYRKASDIPQPAEPAPEPYQWQIGDEIECNGVTRRKVIDRREGWVFLGGVTSPLSQPDWELRRWKLHRKAGDMPDIPPFTEQQVAEFAAVTEPIDDSIGTDGEGQS